MVFLDQFTLYDVFWVAIGLVTASIIRIFYDSYMEKKRLRELDELVVVYNESMNIQNEGIIILSNDSDIVFINKESCRMFGVKEQEVTISFLDENVKIRSQNSLAETKLFDAIEENNSMENAQIITQRNTTSVAISSHIFQPSKVASKNTSWRIIVIRELVEKMKLREKISNSYLDKDISTSLPSRHHLIKHLLLALSNTARVQRSAALGMIGISNYHYLQSQFGVEKIDLLLKSAEKVISESLREGETLYRFDHDNFAIVFKEILDDKESQERIQYLRDQLKNTALTQKINIASTSGICMIRKPYRSAEELIDVCLNSLYGKKAIQPENTENIVLAEEENNTALFSEKLDRKAFETAIENKDFFFFYQPIYALKNGALIGVEALIRLNYKKAGLLMPDVFLQQAAACNMMTEVTSHLLDRVLSQKNFWAAQNNGDMDTTINLAISDIQSGIFAEMLEKKIIEYGIDPSTITIDISEEILEVDYEAVFEECYMLNKLGVKLAIDHFGKGSVSLSHISRLPLHAIKIDGSIITGIEQKEENLRLASGIVSMGRKLNLEVGATFVDSGTIKILLDRIGCQFAQGNHLGKPVPAFEIRSLFDNN